MSQFLLQTLEYGDDLNKQVYRVIAQFLPLIEMKSHRLYQHCQQVANYAIGIAVKMELPKSEIEKVRLAALLHDIGLITIPDAFITKHPYLSQREMSSFKNHAVAGSYMLENIPSCQCLIPLIRCHHESWNGKGYPKRLKGVNIPIGARIIAVADHYDRAINPCTQQWRKNKKEAIRELQDLSGTTFDPDVIKAFVDSLGF